MSWRGLVVGFAVACCAAGSGASLGASLVHRVEIKDIDFGPSLIHVRLGEAVEWTNSDLVAHTATGLDGGWEVEVQPGESGRQVMIQAGTFGYLCRYHPNMRGEIEVSP